MNSTIRYFSVIFTLLLVIACSSQRIAINSSKTGTYDKQPEKIFINAQAVKPNTAFLEALAIDLSSSLRNRDIHSEVYVYEFNSTKADPERVMNQIRNYRPDLILEIKMSLQNQIRNSDGEGLTSYTVKTLLPMNLFLVDTETGNTIWQAKMEVSQNGRFRIEDDKESVHQSSNKIIEALLIDKILKSPFY